MWSRSSLICNDVVAFFSIILHSSTVSWWKFRWSRRRSSFKFTPKELFHKKITFNMRLVLSPPCGSSLTSPTKVHIRDQGSSEIFRIRKSNRSKKIKQVKKHDVARASGALRGSSLTCREEVHCCEAGSSEGVRE